MLFCLICTDKPNALELRLANREAHLKYWGEAGCVKIGGPFTKGLHVTQHDQQIFYWSIATWIAHRLSDLPICRSFRI